MNNEIPTVRIKSDNSLGYAIINETDFDSSEHELFDESATDGESGDGLDDLESVEEITATAVDEPELKTLEFETATLVEQPEQNPDGTPPEPKSRKRRQSVET